MPDTLSHLEGGYLRLQNDIANRLISKEPIEKYYDITEEPFARGKYAMVRRCRERSTGRVFAAKYLRKRNRSKDYRKEILHEVAMLEACKPCSNIVTLHQVFETPSDMVLILELACGGEVQSLVDGEQVPTEATVQMLMRQILKGILYLHHINVAHLDIKPQNVIMTGPIPNCEVKLCDFGISRYLIEGADVREILGTPDYVAPEVLNYEPISLATDMWSVGVLLYVLLSGCSPFGGETKQETFCNISQGRLDFPEDLFEDISEEAKDLMTKLMVINPSSRLTAEQCLKHAWFAKVFSESSTKNGGLTIRSSSMCVPSSKPTTPVPSKRVVPPETKVVLEETVTMTREEEEDNNNTQQNNNNNNNNNNVNNNISRGMGRTRGLSDERRRSLHSNLQNLIERLDNEEFTTSNPTRRVSRNDSMKRASAMQTMPSIRYGKDSGAEILSEQVYKFQRVVLVDEDEGLPPSPASSSADNSSDSSSDTVSEMSIDSSSDRSSIISLDDSLDFHHHFNAAGRIMRQYASCTNVWEATRRQVPTSRQCNETFLRAMSKFREDEIKIRSQVRSKFDVFHSSRLSLPQTTSSNSELGRKCIGVEFVRERNGNLVVIREVRAIQGKKYSQTRELKCESVQSRIRKLQQLKTEQFDNSVF